MKYFFLFYLFIAPQLIYAQQVRQPLTSGYAGLGAYSKKFNDVFGATANQASLAQLKTTSFGVSGERRFMLEELNQYTAIVAVPTASGTFAFQGDYFGSADYNESAVGLAYGRKISNAIDVGTKFNYQMLNIPGYGKASLMNFEIGTIFHLTDNLHSGIHVYNPLNSKIAKTGEERLASIYRIGLGYQASDKVFLSTEVVKQEDQPVSVNAGLQYNLHEKIFVRGGVATANRSSYAGAGLKLNFFRLDVIASYHPQLGFTPGLLLLFNLRKAEEK